MERSDLYTIAKDERRREHTTEMPHPFEQQILSGSLADIQQKFQSGLDSALNLFESDTDPELRKKIEHAVPYLGKVLEWLVVRLRDQNSHRQEFRTYIQQARSAIYDQKEEILALKLFGEDVGATEDRIAEQERVLHILEKFGNRMTGQFLGGVTTNPAEAIIKIINDLDGG